MVLIKGDKFILGASIAIAIVTTASAIAQGNKVQKLNIEIQTLEEKLSNVESANDVLVDEITKLIRGR